MLRGKPPDASGRTTRQVAYLEGFSLHASVHLHANDREGLARFCGYGARPSLSQERLSALPDGRLALRLNAAVLRLLETVVRLARKGALSRMAHVAQALGGAAP